MSNKEAGRRATELFPYGIFILAVSGKGEVGAIVATWVTQVSFDPALVLVSVERNGPMLEMIHAARQFSLSLLDAGSIEAAKLVLKDGPIFDANTDELPFVNGEDAPPRPSAAYATVNCRLREAHPAGDHLLIVGEITGGYAKGRGPVLTLRDTGWKYRKKDPRRKST